VSEFAASTDERSARGAIAIAYAALATCFAITLFTNKTLIGLAPGWHAGRPLTGTVGDYPTQFLLGSAKDGGFCLAVLVLAFLLRKSAAQLLPRLGQRKLWINLLIAFAVASVFLLKLQPAGMGRLYAEASVEPFLMEPGFYHRRILMPALAHGLHLSGVLYGLFFWLVFALTAALANAYLEVKGVVLSRLETASLFTTGIFGTSLGLPGYGEILVLGLALFALLDFERAGRSGIVQLICFGLALLTHESAAMLVFGTLGLCLFGLRFLVHLAALLGFYLLLFALSFGLDVHAAASSQLTGGVSNAGRVVRTFPYVLLAVVTVWKLGLAVAAMAAARSIAAREYRTAAIIGMAFAGGILLCAIATDYSRMIAFGTFALLIALPWVLPTLSDRQRSWLAAANLLFPTIYVSLRGAHSYAGLYGVLLGPVLH
jgi:hypothetical protein